MNTTKTNKTELTVSKYTVEELKTLMTEEEKRLFTIALRWHKGVEKTIADKTLDFTEPIDNNNIYEYAKIIAIKAIKTALCKGYSPMLLKLYYSAIQHAKNPEEFIDGEGGDVIQSVGCFLCSYRGKRLSDVISYDERRKKDITVNLATYRYISRYIHSQKSISLKTAYIEDFTAVTSDTEAIENGVYTDELPLIKIPTKEDIQDYVVYKDSDDIIKSLDLKPREELYLKLRLQGYSFSDIAHKMGVKSKGAVRQYQVQIQKKYIAIYGEIKLPTVAHKEIRSAFERML